MADVFAEKRGGFIFTIVGVPLLLDQDLCLSLSNVVRRGSHMLIKVFYTNKTQLTSARNA